MPSDKGWIKLHRKLLDNDIWRFDQTAWRVFEYFLLSVDHKTGFCKTKIRAIAEFLEIAPSTIYDATRRLQASGMIEIITDNKKTTISICNWEKYQVSTDIKPITNRYQTDNATIYNKNKELRSKNSQTGNKFPSKRTHTHGWERATPAFDIPQPPF